MKNDCEHDWVEAKELDQHQEANWVVMCKVCGEIQYDLKEKK